MKRIAQRIRDTLGAQVAHAQLKGEDVITKLVARAGGVQTKIEVTPVLRGCVYEPTTRTVAPAVEETFGLQATFAAFFARHICTSKPTALPDPTSVSSLYVHSTNLLSRRQTYRRAAKARQWVRVS
jgi:hypothetical protein